MAEIRKREKVEEYNIDEIQVNNKKSEKNIIDKKNKVSSKSTQVSNKKSLWVKFRVFCHGVKSEFLKVHWPSKKDMFRYSIATIFFVVFCSLFFYLIDVIFALFQSIFK